MADELNLRATVTDNFSKPLDNLKRRLVDVKPPPHLKEFAEHFERAKKGAEKFGEAIKTSVEPALAGLGLGSLTLAGALSTVARASTAFGETALSIDRLARVSGLAKDQLLALEKVGKSVSIEPKTMDSAIATFARRLDEMKIHRGELSRLFDDDPIFAKQLIEAKSAGEAFQDVIAKVRQQDKTARGERVASTISEMATGTDALSNFRDKTGPELRALYKQTIAEQAKISDDAVKGAKAWEDSTVRMQTGFENVEKYLSDRFLPLITRLQNTMGGFMSANPGTSVAIGGAAAAGAAGAGLWTIGKVASWFRGAAATAEATGSAGVATAEAAGSTLLPLLRAALPLVGIGTTGAIMAGKTSSWLSSAGLSQFPVLAAAGKYLFPPRVAPGTSGALNDESDPGGILRAARSHAAGFSKPGVHFPAMDGPSLESGPIGKAWQWWQKGFREMLGVGGAHAAEDVPHRAYLGHGPGRTPAGLVSRRHAEALLGHPLGQGDDGQDRDSARERQRGLSLGGLPFDFGRFSGAVKQGVLQGLTDFFTKASFDPAGGVAAFGGAAIASGGRFNGLGGAPHGASRAAGAAQAFRNGPFRGDSPGSAGVGAQLSSLNEQQRQQMVDAIVKQENAPQDSTNPGNLVGHSFATRAAGRQGIYDLLFKSPMYRGKTIGSAMEKYAPWGHGANNPALYARNIVHALTPNQPNLPQNGPDPQLIGGANLMTSGEFTRRTGVTPRVGQDLVTVTTKGGHTFTVNKWAAPNYKAFVENLEARGYNFTGNPQGYNPRSKFGSGGLSEHAYGNAVDINPGANPFTRNTGNMRTDMPPDISALAAKYGLSWGGDWHSVKDPMHFEWRGKPLVAPSSGIRAATAGDVKKSMWGVYNSPENPFKKPHDLPTDEDSPARLARLKAMGLFQGDEDRLTRARREVDRSRALMRGAAPDATGHVTVNLHGFPEQMKSRTSVDGSLFKTVKINRARPMALASTDN